jgi:hypothetical protein
MARFSGGVGGGSGEAGPPGPAGADALWNYLGEYSGGASYAVGDVVTYDGQLWYRANSNGGNVGDTPSEGFIWNLLAAKGADGSDGSGSGGSGFNYLGEYQENTTYEKNDVVTYFNGTYIYVNDDPSTQRPADHFYGSTSTSYWQELISPVPNFRGEWQSGQYVYAMGDVVSFNGTLYIGSSTPGYGPGYGADPDSLNGWQLFLPAGEGFTWRGTWSSDEPAGYSINDVVEYQGSSYLRVDTVSANSQPPFFGPTSPTPGPNSDWELMSSAAEGFTFRGEYENDPIDTYEVNDLVIFEGSMYLCISSLSPMLPPISAGLPNTSQWTLFIQKPSGFNWRGTWSNMASPSYVAEDVVEYEGSIYLCTPQSFPLTNSPPFGNSSSPTPGPNADWELMIQGPGLVWRGEWESMPGEGYYLGDLVSYEGGVYRSTNTSTPDSNPPINGPMQMNPGQIGQKWEIFAAPGEGFNWRGTWSSMNMTPYVANDVVNHNGSLYLAKDQGPNLAGTGTPDMYANGGWVLMTQGFNWRGAWSSNPMGAYGVGDLVSYQGSVYLGVNNMGSPPSGTPGESMNYSWQVFVGSTAPKWRGAWSSMPTPSYVVNDLVSYNGSVWIGVPGSMNMGVMGTPGSSETWQIFASGFRNRGPWLSNPMDSLGAYTINDVVSYLGSSYVRTGSANPEETNPPTDEDGYLYPNWQLLASKGDAGEGFNWLGEFDPISSYVINDVVSYNGSSYIAVGNTPSAGSGIPGDDESQWRLFAARGDGFNWRGVWDEFADPAYQDNDVIFYEGSSYVGQQIGAGSWSQPPGSNNDYWRLFAAEGADSGFGASASYHSRVDQGPQASANLVQAFTFNTTDWQTGILRADNTKIGMLSAGKYNIAFSAQLYQTSGSGTVNIWLNKNGSPMAYTNTKLVVESNAPYRVAAWNFFVDAAANDYYEIMWSSSSTNTVIEYDPAQTINGNLHPEIPSIIVTVNQVG